MTSQPHKNLRHAIIDIAQVAARIDDLHATLQLESSVLKGASYDGATINGTGISDPTAAAALAPKGARHDLAELLTITARIRADAAALAVLVANHPKPNPTRLRRDLARLAAQGDPGCESHARIDVWAIIYRTGTHDGLLAESTPLCRSCYDFLGRHGRLPTKKELSIEKRTGKLRPRAAGTPSAR